MRSFSSLVLGVAALVAGLVTIPTAWIATHVASEDGYVAFSEPFATDPELRGLVAGGLGERLAAVDGVPAVAQGLVARAVTSGADRLARDSAYVEAWNETQRRSHQLMFADDLPEGVEASDRIVVDIGPLADYVLTALQSRLPTSVAAPERLVVPVSGSSDRRLIEVLAGTPDHAVVGLAATVALAAASLLLARSRAGALSKLGVGAVAVAGLLWAAAQVLVPRVLERTPAPDELAANLQQLLADRAVESLQGWLVWVAVGGVVVAVAGLVMRGLADRR